jgi:hypothetical protein
MSMASDDLDFYGEFRNTLDRAVAGRVVLGLLNGEKVLVEDLTSIAHGPKVVSIYHADGNVILVPVASICSAQILPFDE